MRGEFIAFDLETTGLDTSSCEIIEIGIASFRDGELIDQFQSFVKPTVSIPTDITHLTGIHNEDVEGAPRIEDLLTDLEKIFGALPVIAHNAQFDQAFMRRYGLLEHNPVVDTYELAAIMLPTAPRYSLGSLAKTAGIDLERAHRALDDAIATGRLYWHLWEIAVQVPYAVLAEIVSAAKGKRWDLLPLFQSALSDSLRHESGRPILSPFYAEELSHNPLKPSEATRETIDESAVEEIFRQNGKLKGCLESYESRQPQLLMARSVATALNAGGHTMIEAGTGTGKSLAYLIPAALWAAGNDQRVVVSTQTINLQEQLMNKDIPIVKQVVSNDLQAAIMKGRANYLCPRRLDTLRRRRPANLEELRAMAKVLIWLQNGADGDRGDLTLRAAEWNTWNRLSAQDADCTTYRCAAEMHGVCPYYRARRRAEAAHILITNHALLIADANVENRALPEYFNVIIDEAHHLEDAITNGLSRRFEQQMILARIREIGSGRGSTLGDFLTRAQVFVTSDEFDKLKAFIDSISDTLKLMSAKVRNYFRALYEFLKTRESSSRYQVRVLSSHRDSGGFVSVEGAWHQFGEFLLAVTDAIAHLLAALPLYDKYQIPDLDEFNSEIRAHHRYLNALHDYLAQFTLEPDSNAVYSVTPGDNPEHLRIHIAPLHVGPMMDEYLNQRKESIILTSATLQTQGNFDHLKERLYADHYETLAVGSPFDYKRSTLVYVPDDIPEPSQRNGYQKMIERGIIELAAALDGRVMVLFTSYTHLRETSKAITPRLNLGDIMVYDQSFGTSREALLESFKTAQKAVLMGTRSFWEGVDIPGDDLSAVVIARLPFAVPSDPIFSARSESYTNAFQQFAVPDAILRFRQGFGRLIRSNSDRGVVAIFDSRVISKNYGGSFLESLPDCTVKYGTVDNLPPVAKNWIDLS